MKSVLVCLLLTLPLLAPAQNRIPSLDTLRGRSYFILLRDGSQLRGRITDQDSTMLTIRLIDGKRTFVERNLFDRITLTAPTETYYQTTQPLPGDPRLYQFTLLDGTQLQGRIVKQDSAQLVLDTKTLGTVTLPLNQIRRQELIDRFNEPAPDNPTPQWLPWVPTAFAADKGRWYYRNTSVLINQFEYGINNNVSIGATFIYLIVAYAVGLNLKVAAPVSDRLRLGVSGHIYTAGAVDLFGSNANSGVAGIVQAFGTLGSVRQNLTLGIGTFVGGNSFGQSGYLTVGFMQPIGRKLLLISQNNFLIGTIANRVYNPIGILSAGLRINSKQHAFDLLLSAPTFGRVSNPGFLFSYQVRLPASRNQARGN